MNLRRDALTALPPALLVLAWSWRHAAPGLGFHDSGEFGMAAADFGIPHPPGAPTWVLAAGTFVRLGGFADPVRGANLFSGFMAAVAVGLTALLVSMWVRRSAPGGRPWGRVLGGWTAAALLAGTAAFLDQALIAEQYTLLAALLAALLLAATTLLPDAREGPGPGVRAAAGLGLLWGLACGNHLSQLALGAVVIWALVAAAGGDRRRLLRLAAATAAGFLAGASVFVWLMLRSRAEPLLDWGDVETPGRLWWALTRRDWAVRPLAEIPAGFAGAWWRSLDPLGQMGAPGLAAAALGLARLAWSGRRWLAWLALAVVPYALGIFLAHARQAGIGLDYVRFYGVSDWHLPLYLGAAVAAGWAAGVEAGRTDRWPGGRARLIAAAALVAVLSAAGIPTRHAASLRNDAGPAAFVDALLASAPRGALLALDEPDQAFMLGYAHLVQGRRPDVTVAYARPGPGEALAAVVRAGRPWTARDQAAFVAAQVIDRARQPLRIAPPAPDAPLVLDLPRAYPETAGRLLPSGLLFRVAAAPVDSAAARAADAAWRREHGALVPPPDPGARLPRRQAWSRLHLARAEYFTLHGLWDLARREGELALGWLPDQAVALYNLGFVSLQLGRPDAAGFLRRALTVDPDVAGPRTLLAHLALRAGRLDEARALVAEELARHPDDGQARELEAYLKGR